MGVEYRHFMVVDDAHWRPQGDTAARVEAALRSWSLIGQVEHIVDLATYQEKRSDTPNSAASPGPGVAVVYSGARGPAVEAIAGPSLFADITSGDRYLKRMTLVIGDDYRVQWSTDSVYFELVSPPLANGVPITHGGVKPGKPTNRPSRFAVCFSLFDGATRIPLTHTHPAICICLLSERVGDLPGLPPGPQVTPGPRRFLTVRR